MILEIFMYFFVFIFGLCIGSFLNCYIYRLEEGKSMKGRSFCPHCKHMLSWSDLFPVLSFVALGGKCRYCKKKISVQYPLSELVTGLLFVSIFLKFGFSNLLELCFMFYVLCFMIIIFIYDLKHYLIPDKVVFPAIIITFLYQLFENYSLLPNFLMAGFLASMFFLLIFLFSKGKAMGFGDVKLAFLMGLLLGAYNILVALFLAFFFGAIIGLTLMSLKKKSLKSEMPFGPFLVVGTLIALFWGEQLVNLYLHFPLIS